MTHVLDIELGAAAAAATVVYLLSLRCWQWRSCSWCGGVGDCRWCDHGRKYRPGARSIARVTRSRSI